MVLCNSSPPTPRLIAWAIARTSSDCDRLRRSWLLTWSFYQGEGIVICYLSHPHVNIFSRPSGHKLTLRVFFNKDKVRGDILKHFLLTGIYKSIYIQEMQMWKKKKRKSKELRAVENFFVQETPPPPGLYIRHYGYAVNPCTVFFFKKKVLVRSWRIASLTMMLQPSIPRTSDSHLDENFLLQWESDIGADVWRRGASNWLGLYMCV